MKDKCSIKLLTILELRGMYGWNKFRHTKDKKEKNRYILLMTAWIMVVLMIMSYAGGLVYGLHYLKMSHIAPAYIAMMAALLVFVFDVFKAGNVVFAKGGYDFLCALPVSAADIVLSRLITMYLEALVVTAVIFVPGTVVYAICVMPGISFYVMMLLGFFLIPLLPLVFATAIGTLITAVASGMKHKSIVQTMLMLGVVLVVLPASIGTGFIAEEFTPEMFAALADTVGNTIGEVYPPAMWLGEAVLYGNIGKMLLFSGVSIGVTIPVMVLIVCNYARIIRRLFVTSAKHDYQMNTLKRSSMLSALYKREAKRYFVSGIYVTNTIIGPIMACLMAGAVLVAGVERIDTVFPVPVDVVGLLPFVIAAVFCMMTTTACSISMEGRQIWIAQSLPVPVKAWLDSKILLNLSLMLPFYLLSEIMFMIALKPTWQKALWIILIPALYSFFATVIGISVNLKLHSFDWSKEEVVVKQSAASMLGGFAGPLASLVGAGVTFVLPAQWSDFGQAAICLVVAGVTVLLYRSNNKFRFESL